MPIGRLEFHDADANQWVTERPANEDGIRFIGAGKTGVIEILYSEIPGGSWNANRLAKFAERAQQLIDYRIPLNDPELADDPHGINGADPARPNFFWDAGDLVSRPVIISDVTWDGAHLRFTLSRAG